MHYISQKYNFSSDLSRGCVAALGCFDGVHKGHLSILRKTREMADSLGLRAAVLSFEQPPAFSFMPGSGKLLTDCPVRTQLFEKAGIDTVYYLRFEDVKNMEAADFVSSVLKEEIRAEAVVCGYNFTYGRNRTGTPDTLREDFGGRLCVCQPVLQDSEPVSSSRIRRLIADGNVDEAAVLLSRPFSLTAVSVPGRHDGTAIGFPTANLHPDPGMAVPAPGVYTVSAEVEGLGLFPAIADAGYAPSLDKSGIYRVEVHLLNFCRELYGKTITVGFLHRLRAEIHFNSVSELKEAIANDVCTAESYFSEHPLHQ